MVLAFAGDSTITKFLPYAQCSFKFCAKLEKQIVIQSFFYFLLNNVYRTHFESILPCRVFVAFLPQRLSPILPPLKKLTG